MRWLGLLLMLALAPATLRADAGPGCGDVDALGECQGDVMRRCAGGTLEETDCAARHGAGFTCRLTAELGAAQCVFVAADAGPAPTRPPPDDEEPPPEPPSGCGCLRPAPADAVLGAGLVLLIRRRRRT